MTSIIKVENVYSWLITDDLDLKKKLHLSLRAREKGYFHSTAYKKKLWDGYREFFKLTTGAFPTGLLPDVLAALKYLKKPYTLEDHRTKLNWLYTPEQITPQFLNQWLPEGENPIELYDYQADYIRQALRYQRGLVTSPTGSGKTAILVSIMKCIPPKTPVLFMTKNAGLVDQNYEEMKKWGIQDLGRYYGGYKEPNYVMCVTAHKDTLKGIEKLLPKFKVLIVDEVHECMSDVPVTAYKKMKAASARFGISATPFKYAGKDKVQKFTVKGHFGAVFKTTTTESGYLTTANLQERKILSASDCIFYPIDEPNNIAHEPYIDAVTLGIANNFDFHKTVAKLAQSLKGRTLILVERVDQGNYLHQLIPGSRWIYGKDDIKTRKQVYQSLKVDDHAIGICMRHIITSGINVFVHNMINASGGQAEHSVIQQMGRGLRCADDKEILKFYDFLFRTNEYLFKHSMNRIDVLAKEGHKVLVKESLDFL
jgi:superfamily II DNA or RNA helicase